MFTATNIVAKRYNYLTTEKHRWSRNSWGKSWSQADFCVTPDLWCWIDGYLCHWDLLIAQITSLFACVKLLMVLTQCFYYVCITMGTHLFSFPATILPLFTVFPINVKNHVYNRKSGTLGWVSRWRNCLDGLCIRATKGHYVFLALHFLLQFRLMWFDLMWSR